MRDDTKPMKAPALELFYSYAHKDEQMRKKLEEHLAVLQQQGLIAGWHDRQIGAGTEWAQQIDEHLNRAHIILLLISASFLASPYCTGIEMQRAMQRHEAHEARVIPIMLRPVHWQDVPFAKLQLLPTDGKAIASSHWRNQDEAFANVVAGIRKAIEELKLIHEEGGAGAHQFPASPSLPSSPSIWNVPFRRNPFFTGREAIFKQLDTLLQTGKTASLSQPPAISGLGGIGKTQTAVEYAYRTRHAYHYVLWVQANSQETLLSSFVALAALLHLPEQDAQEEQVIVQALTRWLETHSGWLLIFDNADDLAMVRDYLPEGNSGHTLLTTRAQTMGGLARKIELDTMEAEEGAAFLLRRAGIIAADAALNSASATDRALAIEIVGAMHGLPLALDQAGAYIEEMREGLSSYLALYRKQRGELLKRRGGLVPHHPEAVATTWSLAFETIARVNPAAIELMRFCAFLAPDDIPEELIMEGAAYLGPVLGPVAAERGRLNAALADLLKYSLIRRNPSTQTLSMHRLVQAVIKDEMDDETQYQWAERAVRAVRHVFPFNEPPPWPRSQRYLAHAQVGAELIKQWSIALDEAAALLCYTGVYLKNRGHYQEAAPLQQDALAIGETRDGRDHPGTRYLLSNLANLYQNQGKYEQAEPLFQRALAISEKVLGLEHPETASTLDNLAGLYYMQSKDKEAKSLYLRALAIYEKVFGHEHPTTKRVRKNYANLLQKMGQKTGGGDGQN